MKKNNSKIIFNDKKILDILKHEYVKNINEKLEINSLKIKNLIRDQIERLAFEKKIGRLEDMILIISDENLIPDILFYKNENHITEYMHYLNVFFHNPNILIFIREHKSFVYSNYNQHVKEGFYITLKDYIENNQTPNIDLKKINYKKIINNLEINFGKRYFLFKYENFEKNLINLNKIFSSNINTNNIKNIKINKSLTQKQISILLFLEKNLKFQNLKNL